MANIAPYNQTDTKTMSSREIAKLTGKHHTNVVRNIEVMFEKLEDTELKDFKRTYTNVRGETYPCYRLPYREALLVLLGYDARLRAKIIDRMLYLLNPSHSPFAPSVNDSTRIDEMLEGLIHKGST